MVMAPVAMQPQELPQSMLHSTTPAFSPASIASLISRFASGGGDPNAGLLVPTTDTVSGGAETYSLFGDGGGGLNHVFEQNFVSQPSSEAVQKMTHDAAATIEDISDELASASAAIHTEDQMLDSTEL